MIVYLQVAICVVAAGSGASLADGPTSGLVIQNDKDRHVAESNREKSDPL